MSSPARSTTTTGTRAAGLRRRSERTISAQSSGWIIAAPSMPVHAAIGVSTKPGRRDRPGDRGEVDHVATGLAKRGECLPRDEERASQVDGLLEVELLGRRVADLSCDAHACRVDEDVEAAVRLEVGRDEARAFLVVPHVDGYRLRLERTCCLLEALDRPRREGQRVALVAEHPRDRETDPRRAAGHERARHRLILSQTEAARVRRPPRRRERGKGEILSWPSVRVGPRGSFPTLAE